MIDKKVSKVCEARKVPVISNF